MTYRKQHLTNRFAYELGTPNGYLVRVFASLMCETTGVPKLDSDVVRSVDPWTTAMKYIDHMLSRDWELCRVDSFNRKLGQLVVITMERTRV